MGKFNLSKGEEEQKSSKFNLSKEENVPAEESKSSKFNLGKSEATQVEKPKSNKFNLGKGEDVPAEEKKSSKFNLGKNEDALAEGTMSGKSNLVEDKVTHNEGSKSVSNKVETKPALVRDGDSDDGKKHTGLWILLAVLVIGGIICAIVLSKNHKSDNDNNEAPTEQVEGALENEVVEEESVVMEEPVTEQTAEEVVEEENPSQTVSSVQPNTSNQSSTPARQPASYNRTPSANTQNSWGTLSGDLEQNAKAVIRGEFGNNPERKAAIEALGGNYREIQDKVNEIYKTKGLNY